MALIGLPPWNHFSNIDQTAGCRPPPADSADEAAVAISAPVGRALRGERWMRVRRSAEARAGQSTGRAASTMRSVTAVGWEIMATCDDAISTVVAPARLAMNRSVAGGMASSLLA